MAKLLSIGVFAVIWGLFTVPGVQVTSEPVEVASVHFDAVETVLPVVEPAIEDNNVDAGQIYDIVAAESGSLPAAPVAGVYEAPAAYVPNYNVTIHSDTMIADGLSYSDIYMTRKVVYGHNTVNLLGNLRNLSVGDELTITNYGAAHRYVVSDVSLYAKTADGNLENDPKLMRRIAYSAMGHSLALFTCAGTPYGNGDASHRLVVYVDEI